jgi:hypothetical protein
LIIVFVNGVQHHESKFHLTAWLVWVCLPVPDGSGDPHGVLLTMMRQWRQQRQAALQLEVQRIQDIVAAKSLEVTETAAEVKLLVNTAAGAGASVSAAAVPAVLCLPPTASKTIK